MKTVVALTFFFSALTLLVPAASKPNILFLFSDDQSYEAVGAFGHTDIETPHIDRLVTNGTSFTHAYNMGAWHGAVCVASRTMLISGRTLWRASAMWTPGSRKREAGRLWPQRMAAQGYETYFTGKWHIGTDAAKCFDHVSTSARACPVPNPEATIARSPASPTHGVRATRKAVSGKAANTGARCWPMTASHSSTRRRDRRSRSSCTRLQRAPRPPPVAAGICGPLPARPHQGAGKLPPEYPQKGIGAGRDLRDEFLAPFPRDEHAVKVHRQEYYAIITHMDTQVGRILDALEKSGKADNTWIIFTSDHGLAWGITDSLESRTCMTTACACPSSSRGPGVKAGAKIDAPIYLQDVMATALDLAEADKEGIEFRSLLPLLKGEDGGLDAVYAAYTETQRAVIDDGWKLILYPKAKTARLFNLAEDPQERNDLAGGAALEGRKKSLLKKENGTTN
jgi:arylsulfatase A-like enzyme